ncbi:MAG: hypothetical protein IJ899_13595 [Blautia sp.]|nr:hypothetical protein [Blautia sp.]
MKKMLGRALILLVVFVLSVAGTALGLNHSDTQDRQIMNDPTLAELMEEFDGILANRMCGYTKPMQAEFVRDCITPLDTTKKVTFVVNPYDLRVDSLSYEIRTPDGLKVLENRKVKNLTKSDDGFLRTTIEVNSDLRVNQEYLMLIQLETNRGLIYFYTRLVSRSNLNTINHLRFVYNFVERSLDKQSADELVDYLEVEATNDWTNYHTIDVHATLRQISWGALGVRMYRRGIPVIKDINETTASISMEYQLTAVNNDGEDEYYDVSEFYRLRFFESRPYLLDLDRRATQIFSPGVSSISSAGVTLGIRDRNVEYLSNKENGLVAFVQEGDLWTFSPKDGKATRIFTFRKDAGSDYRDARNNHDIQITRLYDNGDLDFVLYGYMNRGEREGQCGVLVYHYDADQNDVEERIFIPSTESYDFLKRDFGRLSYVTEDGRLFLLFAGKLYEVTLSDGSYRVIEEGIDTEQFAVSASRAYAAWSVLEGSQAGAIKVISFDTMETTIRIPDEERQLRLIGFMNEDVVYGVMREKDILSDGDGHIKEGIRMLRFEDFEGNILKKYSPDKDFYITDVSLTSMLVEFNLSQKENGAYVVSKKDNILNNRLLAENSVMVELESDEREGIRVRLAFSDVTMAKEPLVVYAKLKHAVDLSADLGSQSIARDMYYVYAHGNLTGIYYNPAKAVSAADEQLGVVLNRHQQYIWERGNKKTQIQLDSGDVPEIMKTGTMDREALRTGLEGEGDVLDLSGCSLDSILYEVSARRPVLARISKDETVVIIGYDAYNTWLINTKTGEVYANGMEESEEMFEKAGNIYLSFMEAPVY